MVVTMDGKFCTRGGRPARILCTDREGEFSVVALIDGKWIACLRANGRAYPDDIETHGDLVPVPEKRRRRLRGWVNVYRDHDAIHRTRDEAVRSRCGDCIACVEIDVEFCVGEGLTKEKATHEHDNTKS